LWFIHTKDWVGLKAREQTVILIMASIIVASGLMVLSERNRLTELSNKYDELEAQHESLLLSQTEAQKRLESEIVYETLKIVLIEEKMLTSSSPLYNASTVVLSTELVGDVDVPRLIGGYRLLLLNPEEIEARAEAEGAFLYLRFTRFEPNPDNIIVSIQTSGIFDTVAGISIQFKLTGTIYGAWIS
jgi:hypothetical protein